MHGGAADITAWYKRFSAIRPPVNFGAAFFYLEARHSLGIRIRRAATEREIEKLSAMAEKALNEGALGIGISLEYAPGISAPEVEAMMRVAKRFEAPVFFHVRYSGHGRARNQHGRLKRGHIPCRKDRRGRAR